jgi:DNA repair protein RadC
MPDQLPSLILFTLFMGVNAIALIRYLLRKSKKKKTVSAEVVHKQKVESFSKYRGNGKMTRYCVTFLAEGKKRYFYVNELSYNGYRVGEKGKLTYQGDRIIDFH